MTDLFQTNYKYFLTDPELLNVTVCVFMYFCVCGLCILWCFSYAFSFFCIGDLSWLHWTPLRRCGSPRRNTRKIAPVPSTGKHFNGAYLIFAVSHPSPLAWPPSVTLPPSFPTHPSRQRTCRGSHPQLRHAFCVPCPALIRDTLGQDTTGHPLFVLHPSNTKKKKLFRASVNTVNYCFI